MRHRFSVMLSVVLVIGAPLLAVDPPADPLDLMQKHDPKPMVAPLSPSARPANPKTSEAIEKGFKFLEKWQQPNGSWDRIGEIDEMQERDLDLEWRLWLNKEYRDGIVKDLPETKEHEQVADTALAGRAMLIAVVAGRHAEYEAKIKKSIEFLCGQVEMWNGEGKANSIYIQKRLFDPLHDQTPALGEARYYDPTVDTFFTLAFLAEARTRATDKKLLPKMDRALAILKFKVETNQDVHGTWVDDTDPLAKISDTQGFPPVFPMPVRPPVNYAPDNPKLPKADLAKADFYDEDRKNILVHCEQLRDVSIAARMGVDFKRTTRLRAESYLRNSFIEKRWDAMGDGPYVKQVAPRAILLTSVVSAWYQADLTAQTLLEKAQNEVAAGTKTGPDTVEVLRTHAGQTRAELQRHVKKFLAYDNVPWSGPALENLPDCLLAVELFDPAAAKRMGDALEERMLSRQRAEGHFIAGPNDKWLHYMWVGSDRGESIFGTATTLRLLMQLESRKTYMLMER